MSVVATIVITIMLGASAFAGELFRYRGAARDGGALEYVFESDEEDTTTSATKDQVAEIAADFMTTFYGLQVGGARNPGISDDADPVLAGVVF
jgi:hypothetical protein